MIEGPLYASASLNALIACVMSAYRATDATYTLRYDIAIRPISFLCVSLPPAANCCTADIGVAFDFWPPVFEYISVSSTTMFTSSPVDSTWSTPP